MLCLYLTVWNSHLYFVPAVRLSLWVHRVWRTGLTMESGSSKQSWDMHRPPRSSPGHSVQWVFFSYISFYSCHFFNHLCSLPCCPPRRDTHHRDLGSLLFLLLTAFSCNEGEFLDMQSQQCRKCAAGTYSLGTGIAFDGWDRLPSGFVTQGVNTNGEDVQTDCSKSVYVSELRWSIKVLAVLQLSLLMSLQLNLGPKRWLHSLKHRWVHRNTVLRCEPEETWNCVLWVFLPWQQHLLRVLRKCFKNGMLSLTRMFLEVTQGNCLLFV